jgi:DnaJ-domain-containing protein 1
MNALTTIAVILIAFAIGYKVVSWLIDRLKGSQQTAEDTAQDTHEPDPRPDGSYRTTDSNGPRASAEDTRSQTYEDPEIRYAKVLGLPHNFTAPEIKGRFRTLIASYHPDKVSHLGPELQEMADRKTREILEAYEYFRVKYNLK